MKTHTGFKGLSSSSSTYKYSFSAKFAGNNLYQSSNSATLSASAKVSANKVNSYWNLKTQKSTKKVQVKTYFEIRKNGWYKPDKKGKYVKINLKKLNKKGDWYFNNTKTKKLEKLSKVPNITKSSKTKKYVRIITKTVAVSGLQPFVYSNLTISTTINGKEVKKAQTKVYVYSTTDIYFKKDNNLGKAYDKYLKDIIYIDKTSLSVKDYRLKSLIIKIFSTKETKLNSYTKAKMIYDWVHGKVRYEYPMYSGTKHKALGTYKAKIGNCVDQTHLIVSLLRCSGIPSRYINYEKCVFRSGKKVGHVIGETYVNDKWYRFDSTGSANEFGKKIQNVKTWSKNKKTLINLNC